MTHYLHRKKGQDHQGGGEDCREALLPVRTCIHLLKRCCTRQIFVGGIMQILIPLLYAVAKPEFPITDTKSNITKSKEKTRKNPICVLGMFIRSFTVHVLVHALVDIYTDKHM